MKIFLILLFPLTVLADPGAHMTPVRQVRINHAIELQRKILKMPSLEAEAASFKHVPPRQKHK